MNTRVPPWADERYRRVMLATAAGAAAIALVFELVAAEGSPGSSVRMVLYAVVGATALVQLRRSARTEPLLLLVSISYAAATLLDGATEVALGYETGNTLAVLILMMIIFVGTRVSRRPGPVIVGSIGIGFFALATVLIERPPLTVAVGRMLIGIPGQLLAVWLTERLIGSLWEASRIEATHARIQRALARCSQVLLSRRGEEPLASALQALLEATEADYAYIDINRVDADGTVTWEIVAHATGLNAPEGADAFDEGDYAQLPQVMERLAAGLPAEVLVSELAMPIRSRYEAEGIRAELMAPIFIRDRWVGTVGYSDFWRDGSWSPIEVEGLTRAADMVGAYWEREYAREGLEELAIAKDRFIAAISHELRTPLSAVVGFASELSQNVGSYSLDEIAELSTLITTQSIEVAHLVDDLLTAERAASGNLTIQPEVIDLLDESWSLVGSMRVDTGVDVAGTSTSAWADAFRTRQIMRNLLTNAARYGGDEVRIDVFNRADIAVLVVSDDGPGVKGVDVERIFDPYYRSRSDQALPDSVGLGLAVARQLARIMGGDLTYRRREGWTLFELTLPSSREQVPLLAKA